MKRFRVTKTAERLLILLLFRYSAAWVYTFMLNSHWMQQSMSKEIIYSGVNNIVLLVDCYSGA